MKTRITFKGHGSDQSYQIDTVMDIQPADKTMMSFQNVDMVPDWVSKTRWYVKGTSFSFIGNASTDMYPCMHVELRMVI